MTEAPYVPLYDENHDYINEDHIHEFSKALIWDEDDLELPSGYSTGYLLPKLPAALSLANGDEVAENEAEVLERANLQLNSAVLSPVEVPSEHRYSEDGNAALPVRPHKITSKSDWFPLGKESEVETKSKSKSSARKLSSAKVLTTEKLSNEFRLSLSYFFFRWPLLLLVGLWVSFLALVYVFVRAYVALLEYLFTWTGERKRLRDKLRQCKTYDEWVENAIILDKFLGLDKWSEIPSFSYYDHKTIQKTIRRLRSLRIQNNVPDLMVFLQGCLKKNFAGIENRQLYSHRYYGTKNLVNDYIEEVVKCIDCVADSKDQVSPKTKKKFFKTVLKNYGKSALCLSGGACFAYTHFGIVKALLDNDLLPSIISGTSGGGLIAALACTRTDEELKKLLVPQLARKITACEDPWHVWLPRFWRTGARFDAVSWARKSNFFTKGSTTFKEAYKLTGRKLNISTIPAEPYSPVILCNTVTSPDCIIWSSLLATSAVPYILNPVVLMMKDRRTDRAVPFSLGNKWRDGSLRTDIPVDALNTYYNVNFSIVSQVNPHISLFFYAPKGTVGRPVAAARRKIRKHEFASLRGGFVATALEHLIKLEIKKWLQVIKLLDLLPRWLAQDWLSVFLQKFTGTITIWPRNRFKDFLYILLDPNEERMAEYLEKGQRSVFPKILFIKHRLSIERAIDRGREISKKETKMDAFSATNAAIKSLELTPSPVLSDETMAPIIGSIDRINDILADSSESSDDGDFGRFSDQSIDRGLIVSTDDVDSEGSDQEESDYEGKPRRNTIF